MSLHQETMRSINLTQTFQKNISKGFNSIYSWLSRYAFVISSLEMFSMDEPTDVIGDGYGSKMNKIYMKYRVSNYINNTPVTSSNIANIGTLMP